jgi:uncharacterized protein (TIGR01777 family)
LKSNQLKGKVLIAGGNGLVGKKLSEQLLQKGFEVCVLSRNRYDTGMIKNYFWNPDEGEADNEAFKDLNYIIQLSGANISEKRWTKDRKKEIVLSRIKSTDLLFQTTKCNGTKLKAFISASAIGYYGTGSSQDIYTESDPAGKDFLAETCRKWELAADQFHNFGIRTVKIRTGIVLSDKGGALSKMIIPSKFGLGSAYGSGKQYFPWIHIDDLCRIYHKALDDNKMEGAYNAVAPSQITNKDFMRTLSIALHKSFWMPGIPGFVLKILLGELSQSLLTGGKISSDKLLAEGFHFQFNDIESTLIELVKSMQ